MPSDLGSVLPGLIGFDHAGVAVTDLEAAMTFYRDLLGMRVVHREDNLDQQVAEVMLTTGEVRTVSNQLQLLMPLSENSVLQRFLVRQAACITWPLCQMSGPQPRSCVTAVCGCFMMHQEPVPAARRSTLSTPRTLAAFSSSWSSTSRRIRTVSNQVGAERMAVAHAGTDSASIPIFGEGFLR
jgi:methylmalonyl-CoA/ethylmalonyl-CoA epimerase